ncbi:MAG: hypothetical protein ACOC1U_10355 [Spirochaetota bacterium]
MSFARTSAEQGRGFIAPDFRPGVHRFVRRIGGLYIRLAQGVRSYDVTGMERFADAMERFQRHQTRLVVLFRHVAVADGPVVVALADRELPRWCRRAGRALPGLSHVHFLYGKDVLNWAGMLARWAFPRMGGIPVTNGRIDRESQEAIRQVVSRGAFPLAFAPEGQVTYHQFEAFPSVAGAATLPAWAHEYLTRIAPERDGTRPPDESSSPRVRVEVLPLAIGYTYGRKARAVLARAVAILRASLGDPVTPGLPGDPRACARLLLELTERIVGVLESEVPLAAEGVIDQPEYDLSRRVELLCERALEAGERAAGLAGEGSVLSRVFALRYWIMTSKHREDVDLGRVSPLGRAVAGNRATLASGVRAFERLADILEYLHPAYIHERHFAEEIALDRQMDRLVEYALNLCDVVNRAGGGDVSTRFEPGGRVARIIVDSPLDASEVLFSAPSRRAGIAVLRERVDERFRALVERLMRTETGDR